MNLRLSSRELRFRISADEYQALCCERVLKERIELPGDRAIDFSIAVAAAADVVVPDGMKLNVSDFNVRLLVSEDALSELNPERPSHEGLGVEEKLSSGNFLRYSLQIDLKSKR